MILHQVRRTIQRFNLFTSGEKVLIACSGGADSVCLLHVLTELKEELQIELYVGHFNHKLRPESDQDEEFVKALASEYQLGFFSGAEDVKNRAEARSQNLEEAGRELRYAFLEETAGGLGGAKIATAHTRTDQAETVLMRLLRGAGTRGMAGIYPKVNDLIVRPLLEIERYEIESYLQAGKIDYIVDQSNFDTDFFRNRIRWELLPVLRREYDDSIVSRLGQAAEIFREEEVVLEEYARTRFAPLVSVDKQQLHLDGLKTQPLALQRRIVRLYLHMLRGDLRNISFTDVDTILALDRGKEFCLEQDLILQNEQGYLCPVDKDLQCPEYFYTWTGKEPLEIKENGLVFIGEDVPNPEIASLPFDNKSHAFLDRGKLTFPLTVRSRQEGDRYVPLGGPGHVKLKEIFRSQGIPRRLRDLCPVFLSGPDIAWVLGLPVAEKFKLDDSTQDILCIKKVESEGEFEGI